MKMAARKIHELGAKAVVIKGGKALATEKATDLFFDGEAFYLLESEKLHLQITTVQAVHLLHL